MSEIVLSVCSDEDGSQIHVHANMAGLRILEHEIKRMKLRLEQGDCEDAHFFSESWGDGDLSETMLDQEKGKSFRQCHHLKLFSWTDRWIETHRL